MTYLTLAPPPGPDIDADLLGDEGAKLLFEAVASIGFSVVDATLSPPGLLVGLAPAVGLLLDVAVEALLLDDLEYALESFLTRLLNYYFFLNFIF